MSFVALALLAQAAAQPSEPELYYQCEVVRSDSAGKLHGGVTVGSQGAAFDAWARWDQAAADDSAKFNIRWALDGQLRVTWAVVEIEVPAPKAKIGRSVIGLRRPNDDRSGSMSLNGPVMRFSSGAGRPAANADLGTLLVFAQGVESLGWYAIDARSGKGRGLGTIATAPLRDAAASIDGLLAELTARRARYGSDCTRLDQLPQPEPHP